MSSMVTPANEPASDAASSALPVVDAVLDAVANRIVAAKLPEATYRLQFSHAFTFKDAQAIVPYLAALGISHAYASPFVKARAGTSHGYDVVDPNSLNPEIGDEADFNDLSNELATHGMGQILDVVPNHMGIGSGENAWWFDVLENGPGSPYASFFDIDWMPLKPDLANKVLIPILGDQYGKVLEDQQLVLAFEEGAFSVRYFEHRFPIAPQSWGMILSHRVEEIERRLGADHLQMQEYLSILTAIGHFPPKTETDPEQVNTRRREKEVLKRRLLELSTASSEVSDFIAENVAHFNGTRGDAHSFDLLDQLLWDQSYRLAYWRVAADEINYRRFFDVNDLAAIRMENPEVFEKTHGLILRLLAEGKVNGLRIDHPDGLYDPGEYLCRVQRARFLQLCRETFDSMRSAAPMPSAAEGAESSPTPEAALSESAQSVPGETESRPGEGSALADGGSGADGSAGWEPIEAELGARFDELSRVQSDHPLMHALYLVVEKILEPGERLPEKWPIAGTTGYEFLTALNGIFVDHANGNALSTLYGRFIHVHGGPNYKEVIYQCKKLIMRASMSSEINVLAHQLDRISERNRRYRDFTLSSLTDALCEVIANFPVYRTYARDSTVLDRDRHYIEKAVARAKRKNPTTSSSVFDFLRDILLLNDGATDDEAARAARVTFACKFQQVTSPVMAKSVEDTAFYRYNRLVSLNEVGGDPERFGTTVSAFHQQNIERQAHWPHSLLATSTHDTKRGEDVRTRIDVLSEIPKEFRTHLFRWARFNQGKKTAVEEEPAPDRNDEYLLYQSLLGTWPLAPSSPDDRTRYVERIKHYMVKAMREAKEKTSWVSPNEPYEEATGRFVAAILEPSPRNLFLPNFEPFARRVADMGMWSSLSQTVAKLACPGVPDFYQGTELWDDSLVDPDNRRPVDYPRRREELESLKQRLDSAPGSASLGELAKELVTQRVDGQIKLFVIWRMLGLRREQPGLCTGGRYIPLEATGVKKDHLCAFARKTPQAAILVVVPRLVTQLIGDAAGPPIGEEIWGDTALLVPQQCRGAKFRNVFTGDEIDGTALSADLSSPGRLPVATILGPFPVAVLQRLD